MDRMRVRTDLALEARESFDGSDTEVHGVVVEEEYEEALHTFAVSYELI